MKDPAFLFYTNDFMSGTQFMTNEQLGIYMRLLMAQHQHGHLKESQMNFICSSLDSVVMEKFIKDPDGLFYNERLQIEIDKRKAFIDSRSGNRKGKTKSKEVKITTKSYDIHMVNRDRDVDLIVNDIEPKDFLKEKNEIVLLDIQQKFPIDQWEQCLNSWNLSIMGGVGQPGKWNWTGDESADMKSLFSLLRKWCSTWKFKIEENKREKSDTTSILIQNQKSLEDLYGAKRQ